MPVTSVPMRLPSTRLPVVPLSSSDAVSCVLPEMTLPAPAAVPPMVFAAAAVDLDAVAVVAQGGGAGGVGADVVARDQVAASLPVSMTCDAVPGRCPR